MIIVAAGMTIARSIGFIEPFMFVAVSWRIEVTTQGLPSSIARASRVLKNEAFD
jgi:hypothetical protein